MSKYEFHSHVRYSECGEDGRLSLKSVVDYFQDTATFQGEHLGIGVGYLKKQNIAWILTSWQIITDHFPKLAEPVTAQTWAYDFKNFYGLRNLVLLDGEGRKAAWANSVWVLMDMKRMRPVKVPPLLLEKYGSDEPLEMEYAPRKIKEPETGEEMTPFAVVKTHLDTNHHVNNAQYIEIAREAAEAEIAKRKAASGRAENAAPARLDAQFKKMALLGDTVYPFLHIEGDAEQPVREITTELRDGNGECYAIVRIR